MTATMLISQVQNRIMTKTQNTTFRSRENKKEPTGSWFAIGITPAESGDWWRNQVGGDS